MDQNTITSPEVSPQSTTVQPGVSTSEFWLAVVNKGIGLLVLGGLIPANQAGLLNSNLSAVVLGVFGLMSASSMIYTLSRSWVKVRQGDAASVKPLAGLSQVTVTPHPPVGQYP